MRYIDPDLPRPRIKVIESEEYVSMLELRKILIEASKRVRAPEINDLIEYTGLYKELVEKDIPIEKLKELRERLESEKGIHPKYAAILVSHMPVCADEISEILPRSVLRDMRPEDLEEIAERFRSVLKESTED